MNFDNITFWDAVKIGAAIGIGQSLASLLFRFLKALFGVGKETE